MKKCNKCGAVKELCLFYNQKGTRDGKTTYCIECIKKRPYDPVKRKIVKDRYRINNPGKCREHSTNSRRRNPETHKKWVKQNKEKVTAYKASNRAKRKSALGKYTGEQILNLLKLQNGKCPCCKVDITKGFHRDHIKALACGGSNDITNIQLLCAKCNLQKGKKDSVEFMQTLGYLL